MSAKIIAFPTRKPAPLPEALIATKGKKATSKTATEAMAGVNLDALRERIKLLREHSFPHDEISLEDDGTGAPDEACPFALTLAGSQLLSKIFSAYGLRLETMSTYGDLIANYLYVLRLSNELDLWSPWSCSVSGKDTWHARVLAEDAEMAQVLDALYANDVAEAARLHQRFGTVQKIARKYIENLPAQRAYYAELDALVESKIEAYKKLPALNRQVQEEARLKTLAQAAIADSEKKKKSKPRK